MSTKVIIIGAGPAGYAAGIRAAQLGAEVTVIEKDKVGGTCLNRGCIPIKALLESVQVLRKAREAEEFGLEITEVKPNLLKMQEKKQEIVDKLASGMEKLFQVNKVKYVKESAKLIDKNKVRVGNKDLIADKVVIATGGQAAKLPIFDFNHHSVLTSKEGLELKEIPKSILILGGGGIGCEFATIFNALGTQVTIIEIMSQILPLEDEYIAGQMQTILKKRGVKILTKTKIEKVREYNSEGLIILLSNGQEIFCNKLLVSVGIRPNTEELGLEDVGVKKDNKGFITVNNKMETNIEGIYAAGDVVGRMPLAYVASTEAVVAVENALGAKQEMNYDVIPSCIFTQPEIGTVGITLNKAKEMGVKAKISRFSFRASGRALTIREGEGFVQLVVDEDTDKILGAQILGPQAVNLVHEVALAIKLRASPSDIGNLVHGHPTLSEAIKEAAQHVYQAVHII